VTPRNESFTFRAPLPPEKRAVPETMPSICLSYEAAAKSGEGCQTAPDEAVFAQHQS